MKNETSTPSNSLYKESFEVSCSVEEASVSIDMSKLDDQTLRNLAETHIIQRVLGTTASSEKSRFKTSSELTGNELKTATTQAVQTALNDKASEILANGWTPGSRSGGLDKGLVSWLRGTFRMSQEHGVKDITAKFNEFSLENQAELKEQYIKSVKLAKLLSQPATPEEEEDNTAN